MPLHERHSYVTLSTNDEYAVGALVLGHSLRRAGTSKEITVLITEGVSRGFRQILHGVYDNIIVVKPLQSFNIHNLRLIGRPNLGIAYTKLYSWRLVQFSKCVFLDADTIVLQNIDELFEREELSAAPDISWPDMFNSGVFVFRPSLKTFSELFSLAKTKDSFDGGDQGLLNDYFSGWSTESLGKHLPFLYNCSCWVTPNDQLVFYTRAPAWKKFGSQVKVAHFAGFAKPWKYSLAANDATIGRAIEQLEGSNTIFTNAEQISVLALWWAIFFKRVKHHLSYGMFLSTTFEPVPRLPSPLTPVGDHVSQCQESTQFSLENEQYHPEFHDTSFDHLHSGQRVDEAKRLEKYYVYEEPPKPMKPLVRKYCEGRREHERHELHFYQQPTYHEREQNQHHSEQYRSQHTSQKYHQEHYDSSCRENPPLQQQQYRQSEMHNQTQDYKQQRQQWHDQVHHELPLSAPSSTQNRVNTQRNVPSIQLSVSPQPQSLPEPPDVRNDKDPLFFAPDPMCCECLKELQWSRQFVDPFHRRLISPMSPLSVTTRVRRRSMPLLPLGPQLIRGLQKMALPIVVNDEPIKTNGIQSRKRERESYLHQIQKGKSGKKRRWRKSVERGKLLDAAKKKIQLKENGSMLTTVSSPMSTSGMSRTHQREEGIKPPPTALDLESGLTSRLDKRHFDAKKGDKAKCLTTSTLEHTLKDALDTSSKQPTRYDKVMLARSTASSGVRRMKLKEENMRPLGLFSNSIATKAKTATKTPESNVIDAASPKEPVMDFPVSQQGETPAPNILVLMSEKELKSVEPKEGKAMQDYSEDDKVESQKPKKVLEATAESTSVSDAPWLPRLVKTRSAPKKLSQGTQYFCGRHQPHSPPPAWRMFAWERGDIDYTGSDRFSNILARIRTTIQQTEEEAMPIGVWL